MNTEYQYRKKPVVIEAFQFTRRNNGPVARPEWFEDAVTRNDVILQNTGKWADPTQLAYCEIKTLEGVMRGNEGDWIILGVKGEIYPCRGDIFEATYERATEAATPAPGADHLTPENIEALARDLEAMARGEAEVPAVDRDWVTRSGIIAKVIRHLTAPKTPEIEGIGQAPAAAAPTIDTPEFREFLAQTGADMPEDFDCTTYPISALVRHIDAALARARKEGEEAARQELAETKAFLYVRSNSLELAKVEIADLRARLASAGAGSELEDASKQEVEAFEKWATDRHFDMTLHPLHWLFLNEQTHAARQGWKAALSFARAELARTTNEGKQNG